MGQLAGRGLGSRLRVKRGKVGQATTVLRAGPERSRNWLNTSRWQRLRRRILERDGYVCQQTGVLLVGKHPAPNSPVVDHKIPHRGNPDLFWDANNLQAVAKEWHDSNKQGMEKSGQV